MNFKSSLALSAAVLLSASAFAADSYAPNAAATPEKLLPSGSGSAITQTQAATTTDPASKDAATSTSASQETSTTTTTDNVTGDSKTTESTQVKETEAKSAPAVESSTTATSQTTTSATNPNNPAQGNNVQKLFHMLQHSNQPQSGATSPETQPGSSAKTAQ